MNQKVYYINELGYSSGIHHFDKHRLPQGYIDLLSWHSLGWNYLNEIQGENNIIIIQTPCNNELEKLQLVLPLLDKHKIFITQESNIYDWFDWGGKEQELYIQILSKCSGFLYHSEHDKKVMEIFISNFVKYPGCSNLFIDQPKSFKTGKYIIVASPLKGYQRGMISHKLAVDTIKHIPIYALQYTRPPQIHTSKMFIPRPDVYNLEGINLIDRMNVDQWLGFIHNSKFGIDIHREFSGGNVSLEFGSLAAPLVGNINLDTQKNIFPDLSFDYKDYNNIKKSIKMLNEDKDFYEEVSKKALVNVKEKYNSKLITSTFNIELNKLL